MSSPPQLQQTQQQQQQQQRRTEEAKTAFTATLTSVSQNLDSELIERTKILHSNASALGKQTEDVRQATADLGRRNDELEKVVDEGWAGLKEIGDVQNWAELIERDLLVLEETLRLVEGHHRDHGDGDYDGEEEREHDQNQDRSQINGDGKDKGKRTSWMKWW